MAKTLAFGGVHVVTAFSVTYLITGSVAMSGAVTFVEPIVNTVVHYFFDRAWEKRQHAKALRSQGRAADGYGQASGQMPIHAPGQAATSPA
ncbi:hypothetical protein GCM10007242_47020 [Pigmentiphaga litoralis]|uniref:DUF2061 domain-containing protein n=1 Tax=Pigmentiphaga litoralis TaxID=516702 RepID=UPI001673CAEB|nr:DUF2061 domain-containing protein [Pigmentiphaga litoralis]GGX34710.1 hypothetical protein GCM10007242_47020 [Pigmentiphaga litoralis]